LGLREWSITYAIGKGRIRAMRSAPGGRWRIPAAELDRLLTKGTQPLRPIARRLPWKARKKRP
jgi:hypothetical protein